MKIIRIKTPSTFFSTPLKIKIWISVLALFSVSLAAAETKNNDTMSVSVDSYDWVGELPSSNIVVLKNLYGSIRSRNHQEAKVFLHASIQKMGEQPLVPEFKHELTNGKLFIEVLYPKPIKDSQDQFLARTDVSILFPDYISLYAETDFGLIKIDKTASQIEAKSQTGEIKLTTTGLFKASSSSGSVSVQLRGNKVHGQSSVSTDKGHINAKIFDDMAIATYVQTEGKVLFNGKPIQQNLGQQNLDEKKPIYSHGQHPLSLELISEIGDVSVQVVAPPELEHSVVPVTPSEVDIDVRDLPKATPWKPGDPIIDRDDKRDNRTKK